MKISMSEFSALSASEVHITAWLPIDNELLLSLDTESIDGLGYEDGWIISSIKRRDSPIARSSRKQLSSESVELLKSISSKIHIFDLKERFDSFRCCDGGHSEAFIDLHDFSVSIKLKFLLSSANNVPSLNGLTELWHKMGQLAFEE